MHFEIYTGMSIVTKLTFLFTTQQPLLAQDYFQAVKMIEKFIDDCLNFHDIFFNVKIYCRMSQPSLLGNHNFYIRKFVTRDMPF